MTTTETADAAASGRASDADSPEQAPHLRTFEDARAGARDAPPGREPVPLVPAGASVCPHPGPAPQDGLGSVVRQRPAAGGHPLRAPRHLPRPRLGLLARLAGGGRPRPHPPEGPPPPPPPRPKGGGGAP